MTSQAIAARYGKALFDVSLKEGDPRVVEKELVAISEMLTAHRELQQALTSPAVPVTKKQSIIKAIVDRAGVTPIIARTLALLASRDRLALLPDLLRSYQERLLAREGVARAEITTATPVSPERLQQIERGLAAATGRRLTVTASVDPSIIGGVVARVGGTLYDGSVATQLRRLSETMSGSRL